MRNYCKSSALSPYEHSARTLAFALRAVIFQCAAPLNGGRGSPTTTRLLCRIAKSPSPGSYSAAVCKESDHSRSLSSPLSGGTATKRTRSPSVTVYHLRETPSAAAEGGRDAQFGSRLLVKESLLLLFLCFFFFLSGVITHSGSMKTQTGFSLWAPGKKKTPHS